MNSLEGIRIFGWLTIPRLPKIFPVIVGLQRYRVELPPLMNNSFVGFKLNTRGIEKNWQSFNPENEQPLLINITDKEKCKYRGIYMDCVRALDFIFSNEDMKLDITRVIALGGSRGETLALVAAALMPTRINSVVASKPVFCDWKYKFEVLKKKPQIKFPINKIIEYINQEKVFSEEQVLQTLHYFDLQNFTPKIKASVNYAVGLLDEFAPPGSAFSSYFKLSPFALPKSELYVFPKSGHEITASHAHYMGIWFNEKTVKSNKK